jgi:HlyD family secretion protein
MLVTAGQLLAELDPVDLDDRVASGRLAAQRAASAVRTAQAQLSRSAEPRASLPWPARVVPPNCVRAVSSARRRPTPSEQEANAATAVVGRQVPPSWRRRGAITNARWPMSLASANCVRRRCLTSPVDGVVSARLVEPGSTVVAGQAVLQLIDPASLWIKARIDQGQAGGVRVGQAAEIVMRSAAGRVYRGRSPARRLARATRSTEERIVNVGFAATPRCALDR